MGFYRTFYYLFGWDYIGEKEKEQINKTHYHKHILLMSLKKYFKKKKKRELNKKQYDGSLTNSLLIML